VNREIRLVPALKVVPSRGLTWKQFLLASSLKFRPYFLTYFHEKCAKNARGFDNRSKFWKLEPKNANKNRFVGMLFAHLLAPPSKGERRMRKMITFIQKRIFQM